MPKPFHAVRRVSARKRLASCERKVGARWGAADNAFVGSRRDRFAGAAASKILHVIVTPRFVMWDKEIKHERVGYGEFMVRRHNFEHHLRDRLAPAEARGDVERYLQTVLRYSGRKPFAKYIDACNWWRAWGLGG
jgi:hypothetical protein